MEIKNLESILLFVNTMVNVDRGFREIESLFDNEPCFLNDEDADEYIEVTTEFDYMKETFRTWEREYEKNQYVDLREVDMIANNLDFIRYYITSINKLF